MKREFWVVLIMFLIATAVAYFSFHVGESRGVDFTEIKYNEALDNANRTIDSLENDLFHKAIQKEMLRFERDSLRARDSLLGIAVLNGERNLRIVREKYNNLQHIEKMNSEAIKNYFDSTFKE